jgi:hypothetical protein
VFEEGGEFSLWEGMEEWAVVGGCESTECGSGEEASGCEGHGASGDGGGSRVSCRSALWSAVGSRLNFLAQPRCVCRQTIKLQTSIHVLRMCAISCYIRESPQHLSVSNLKIYYFLTFER